MQNDGTRTEYFLQAVSENNWRFLLKNVWPQGGGGGFLPVTSPMDKDSMSKKTRTRKHGSSQAVPSHFAMNRECFMGLYNTISEGMVYTGPTGDVVHANPAFCTMVGYDEQELIGRCMLDYILAEERGTMEAFVAALMAGADAVSEVETVFVRKHGASVPGRVNFWINRDETGKPVGVWGMVCDLSGQREAERQAAMSLEQHRFLAENTEDVIWAVNNNLEYVYVSPSVERLRGFAPEEIIGCPVEESMTPEAFKAVRAVMKEAMESIAAGEELQSQRLELEMQCKDGGTVWVETMAKGMWDVNGEWMGIVGSSRDISDRILMESRLKEGERSLRALLNATNDSVALFRLDGTIVTANQPLADLVGLPLDALVGLNMFDHLQDSILRPVREAVDKAVETQQPSVAEGMWSGRILEANFYPVVDSGLVTTIAVFARDITDARYAEEERKKTQEKYRLIVETANEGILGLDADGRITYANEFMAELLGYQPYEIIGQLITDYTHPAELEDHEQRMVNRRNGKEDRFERRYIRKDGAVITGLVSVAPMMADDDSFLGSFAMIADITEVKQAHQRLLTILDGMDADIYVSDMETNEILFMNAYMQKRFRKFEPGMTCHQFVRSYDQQCAFCPKPDLLDANGKPVDTVVTERYSKTFDRWILNHDRAIEWLEGRLVHMHMGADITELKSMAVELREAMDKAEAANLSKNEFLANMSHEIRTPLNGLLGMLQLLELTNLEPMQRDYLNTAHESGRNLLQILNDILDLSKVESGKLELDAVDFELGDLLDSVVAVFRHQAEGRGIEMSWHIDESLPRYFTADKGRLRQILFNLVGNAAKFTVTGSIRVEAYPLKASRHGDTMNIYFQVSDTGIGIPDDKLGAVFNPFTQVDGSMKRKFQGTGLGLSIVHRLVLLMNGTIAIMSEQGKGTSIVFTAEAGVSEGTTEEEKSGVESTSMTSLSILVAEDERVNRVVVDRILGKLGHRATCVESGEEALELLKQQSFDLILTDIQMPGLDGVETARAIRGDLGVETPIIALTAHAMKGDKERFMEAGMNGYIAKPFEMAELEFEINRVMEETAGK